MTDVFVPGDTPGEIIARIRGERNGLKWMWRNMQLEPAQKAEISRRFYQLTEMLGDQEKIDAT